MDLNFALIILAAFVQFILGALWYSPLVFGKWWMEIMEVTANSREELEAMQKEMMPFYGLQFGLTLMSTVVLALFASYVTAANVGFNAYGFSAWIWLGFIVPTQVGSVIWGNTKKKFWKKQIFLMTSYQLIALMIASFILSM